MLAVMYHYVRPTDADFPALRYLHLDDFRRQLDHLGDTYGFVARDEFEAAIGGRRPVPEGVVLTFDDGLVDHVAHVLPELERRGLWGAFYVPAGPFLDGRRLDVHRVHALLGRVDPARVLEALESALTSDDLDPAEVDRLRGQVYSSRDDGDAALEVRTLLNYTVQPERRSALLDAVEERVGRDTEPWYLDESGLRALVEAGMVVGSHSVSHRVMAQLDAEAQLREISDSFRWLESVIGSGTPRTFCYPYGGAHTFTSATEAILERSGVIWSYSVDPRPIDSADLDHARHALPRIDCADLPYGRAHSGR